MVEVILFGFGLMVGSFANAVVWRVHERRALNDERSTSKAGRLKSDREALNFERSTSITRGRSMCPDCRHQLGALDLIPVVSWVFLRGKCRYCRKSISAQYPVVELVMAGFFALSGDSLLVARFSFHEIVGLGFWLYFLTVLIVLAVYDLRWYILPDVVLLPAIIVGVVQLGVWGALGRSAGELVWYLVAAMVAGGSFYAVAALSGGKWMGGGDIKLAFLMGLVLGPAKITLAMFLAFNVAAVVGVGLIAFKLKSRRDHIPFGPFLVGGTVAAQIYGPELIKWYLHLAGVN